MFTGFIIVCNLQRSGVRAVLIIVAGAMEIVIIAVGVVGPRNNQMTLNDILH